MMRVLGRLLGGIGLATALVCAVTAAQAGKRHGFWKPEFKLEFLGRHEGGGVGAAEIAAYDKRTKRLFVTNAAENKLVIINISNPAAPKEVKSIDLSPYGGGPNSAAVSHGRVAVAVEASPKTDPGSVVFFDTNGNFKGKVEVGALPDMLTFTPDGKYLLVANEGEPNSYNQPDSVDPEGSISIISTSGHKVTQRDVRTADFKRFNGKEAALRARGIRIYGPNASSAQDFEPEYIAVDEDSRTAWVTLQENNALAIVDIRHAYVREVVPLGYKDHSLARNGLDASDRDDAINIRPWPVLGMYQPDAIAHFKVKGRSYLITANEGDARDWPGFAEEARVKDLFLDPAAFPDPTLTEDENLGRLTVTSVNGDTDSDGDYDKLYVLGGRSFSIWNAYGGLVYDSGDKLEKITAAALPNQFNANNDEDDTFDNRSDNKGPEPEGVAVGEVLGRTLAFVGLERIGGVATFDVSNPYAPKFQHYINTRAFDGSVGPDSGPEGVLFISRGDSPTRDPLVVVTNEISGTVAIFAVRSSVREHHGHHAKR
jgi:DNA-binding beta-propeller fold protein YncE